MPNNPGDAGYDGPLNGMEEICKHLRIGRECLKELLSAGLPCRMIGKKLSSHTKLVDAFYLNFILKSPPKNIPEILSED